MLIATYGSFSPQPDFFGAGPGNGEDVGGTGVTLGGEIGSGHDGPIRPDDPHLRFPFGF